MAGHDALCRPALLVLGLAWPAAADAAKRKPCSKTPTAVRCLATTRGAEPLAILPSGTVPKTAALQAFSETFGKLPGVAERPSATGRLFDGTPVVRAIAGVRSQLTRAQRRTVDRRLRTASAAKGAPAAVVAQWQALVDAARKRVEFRLGIKLNVPIALKLAAADVKGDLYGLTTREQGDKACTINIYPQAWKGGAKATTAAGDFVAHHEVFHCFQFQQMAFGKKGVDWFVEGGADWVAADLLATEGKTSTGWPTEDGTWDEWLKAPGFPLFSRSYSAIGFFAQMEASGMDVWATLKRMLTAGGPEAVYAEAGDQFVETWGSGYYREPAIGPGWDLQSPGITATKPSIATTAIGDGASTTVNAAKHAAALRRLDLGADVVEFRTAGAHGRLRAADGTLLPFGDGAYCARANGCAPPPGCPALPAVARGVARLALVGHETIAKLTARGRSLKDWCGDPNRVAPAQPGTGTEETGGGGVGGGSSTTKLTVSGAATNTITSDGACDTAPNPETGNLQVVFIQPYSNTDKLDQMTFTLRWTGPGVYEDAPSRFSYQAPGTTLFQGYSTWNGGYDAQGYKTYTPSWKITVDQADGTGLRGTASGTLKGPYDSDGQVTVSGVWRCRP